MTLRDIYVSYIDILPTYISGTHTPTHSASCHYRYASAHAARILIAKVREYDYTSACGVADRLLVLSQEVDIPSAVLLMKRTVPEFKSRNSPYEQYDLQVEREQQSTAQQTA